MRFLAIRAVLAVFFIIILFFIIAFARGYRFSMTDKKLVSTGILAVSSSPDGAKIIVNDRFKGATNTNLTVPPGTYTVTITKDGYIDWKDTVTVKGEIVTKIDALLLPQNPSLSPLTSLGVAKAQYFPISDKVFFISDNINRATQSAALEEDEVPLEKDGVYVLDIGKNPLSIFDPLKLLVARSTFPAGSDISRHEITLSPDGDQFIFTLLNKADVPIKSYLLPTDDISNQLFDITASKNQIETAWRAKTASTSAKILETFKKPLPQTATEAFDVIAFSPDESKILYLAKTTTTIPVVIKPRLVGSNQTPEVREITAGELYVYDKKDDRNYHINIPDNRTNKTNNAAKIQNTIFWYSDSNRLIIKEADRIAIMDYDGTHKQTVYSGPFEDEFLAVSGDGKLLILANLNPQNNDYPDVYAVGIR